MSAIRRCCLLLAFALFGGIASARAQDPAAGPDLTKVRAHFGSLWLDPRLVLTNLGVDNNVFNEPDIAPPKKDFTLTLTPYVDMWLRVGPTWFKGLVKEDLVWFQRYSSERSVNNTYALAWQVPLNRLRFEISDTWLKTRDRPGFEIDARSLRWETNFAGRAEVRALAKTFVGVRGQRSKVDFDQDAVYLGNSLQYELDRVVTSGGLTLRHDLTPLTSITFAADRSEDRFVYSTNRDSNSTSLSGTVTLDPAALIKGTATFGYRDFKPLSPDLPGYQGATVAVAVSYTFLGATKATVGATRDVQYSYEVNQPYYLLTGINLSLAQQVFGPFDIVGRFGKQHLAYTDRLDTSIRLPERVDTVDQLGGGVGYHLSSGLRIGVNLDYQRRVSGIALNQYHGFRLGTAVTYGS